MGLCSGVEYSIEHLYNDLKIAVHKWSLSKLMKQEQFCQEEWEKIQFENVNKTQEISAVIAAINFNKCRCFIMNLVKLFLYPFNFVSLYTFYSVFVQVNREIVLKRLKTEVIVFYKRTYPFQMRCEDVEERQIQSMHLYFYVNYLLVQMYQIRPCRTYSQ